MLCARIHRHARIEGGIWKIAEAAVDLLFSHWGPGHCKQMYQRETWGSEPWIII
jgi:hypothetical protein